MAEIKLPAGWYKGLPNGLPLDVAREMIADDKPIREKFVHKKTGNVSGRSEEFVFMIPGTFDRINYIYLGPEVEEAVRKYS